MLSCFHELLYILQLLAVLQGEGVQKRQSHARRRVWAATHLRHGWQLAAHVAWEPTAAPGPASSWEQRPLCMGHGKKGASHEGTSWEHTGDTACAARKPIHPWQVRISEWFQNPSGTGGFPWVAQAAANTSVRGTIRPIAAAHALKSRNKLRSKFRDSLFCLPRSRAVHVLGFEAISKAKQCSSRLSQTRLWQRQHSQANFFDVLLWFLLRAVS